ncbi:hypothetical protein FEK46_03055 [Escherichia sp. E4736]|nr:hypothetical protein FEK46_03055 [Escherichia sp. E4736]
MKRVKASATLRCVRASFARCSTRRAICGINHQPGLVGLIRRVSVASGKLAPFAGCGVNALSGLRLSPVL